MPSKPAVISRGALLVTGFLTLCTGIVIAQTPQPAPNKTGLVANYGKLPLSFEPNQGQLGRFGQFDPSVKFLARGSGYSLFLTDTSAVLSLIKSSKSSQHHTQFDKPQPQSRQTDIIRMRVAGANPNARIEGQDQLPGAAIYYTLNGTTPTTASTQYSGPIAVSKSETIKAIAIANEHPASSVASATYTIN